MPVHTKHKTPFWHSNLQLFHTAQVTEHLYLKIMQNFLDLLQHLQKPLTCAAVISWLYICNKNWINLVLTNTSKPDLYEATCATSQFITIFGMCLLTLQGRLYILNWHTQYAQYLTTVYTMYKNNIASHQSVGRQCHQTYNTMSVSCHCHMKQ